MSDNKTFLHHPTYKAALEEGLKILPLFRPKSNTREDSKEHLGSLGVSELQSLKENPKAP